MNLHAIAVNWKDNPISEWSIKEISSNEEVAKVFLRNGKFYLTGLSSQENEQESLMACLREAEFLTKRVKFN